MRINFVSILIGGIINNYQSISSVEGILERLYSIKETAKIPTGSNYIFDRIKLTGENSVYQPIKNNTIYIKQSSR